MNILMIGFPDKPNIAGSGGIETHIYNLSKSLQKMGVNVKVVEFEDFKDISDLEKITIKRISRRQPIFALQALLAYLIRKKEFDIIHSHAPLTSILFSIMKQKVVYTSHCPFWTTRNVNLSPVLVNTIMVQEKLATRLAKACFALSKSMQKRMKKLNKNTIMIGQGVDTTFYKPKRHRKNGKLKLLFIGRLTPVKGLEYLVYAADILRCQHIDFKITIIGPKSASFVGKEDYYYKFVKNEIKRLDLEKYFVFTGEINNDTLKRRYLQNSDIFVFPSLGEAAPMAILEAMSCGLPIIVSNYKGVKDIIKDGKEGFIVEKKNPKMLAKKIIELWENKNLMKKMSKDARKKAEKFSWKKMAAKVFKVYQSVK